MCCSSPPQIRYRRYETPDDARLMPRICASDGSLRLLGTASCRSGHRHPSQQPRVDLECATCWRSIPLTRVDSMKLGYKPGVQNVVEGAGIVTAALLVEFALCALLDPHSRDSC